MLATLPEPTLSFTLPSLHDGLTLNCRIYHPHSLAASPRAPPWQKHAAIIAHPYAPLGGCYDDPIVDIVAGTLLRLGFLVGTFNFRFDAQSNPHICIPGTLRPCSQRALTPRPVIQRCPRFRRPNLMDGQG